MLLHNIFHGQRDVIFVFLTEYVLINLSTTGFTLDGTVKIIDFGLARIVENATVSNDVFEMSGETGSLRYMAPEVANCQPYNQKADVVS
jgi:serine/threonine protein kinase